MISESIQSSIAKSKWLKELFEKGAALVKEGNDVIDLAIGNPTVEPPAAFRAALLELVSSGRPGLHRYTPNAGLPETRAYVADGLARETGVPFTMDDVVITTGAAGGLNVALKTLLNPGDEVIVFCPYFPEYLAYIDNVGARAIVVETDRNFRIDFAALERAIHPRTRAILINSPNNPTGVVYSEEELHQLGEVLRRASRTVAPKGKPIFLLADEPYKKIIFDGKTVPVVFKHYDAVISAYSYSKDLAIPGERLGYLAVSPYCPERKWIAEGFVFANRILGFVNPPALMQRALVATGAVQVDLSIYQRNRDLLVHRMRELGFQLENPSGAFYVFPKTPEPDDVKFVNRALEKHIVLAPGSGFGRAGYFRVTFCFQTELLEKFLQRLATFV